MVTGPTCNNAKETEKYCVHRQAIKQE